MKCISLSGIKTAFPQLFALFLYSRIIFLWSYEYQNHFKNRPWRALAAKRPTFKNLCFIYVKPYFSSPGGARAPKMHLRTASNFQHEFAKISNSNFTPKSSQTGAQMGATGDLGDLPGRARALHGRPWGCTGRPRAPPRDFRAPPGRAHMLSGSLRGHPRPPPRPKITKNHKKKT